MQREKSEMMVAVKVIRDCEIKFEWVKEGTARLCLLLLLSALGFVGGTFSVSFIPFVHACFRRETQGLLSCVITMCFGLRQHRQTPESWVGSFVLLLSVYDGRCWTSRHAARRRQGVPSGKFEKCLVTMKACKSGRWEIHPER